MEKQITHQEYKDALLIVNLYKNQIDKISIEIKNETKSLPIDELNIYELNKVFITRSNVSRRLFSFLIQYYTNNSLIEDNNTTQFNENALMRISKLNYLKLKEFKIYRNVGKVLINELKAFSQLNDIILK
jgi:hypothetical protein